MDPHSPPLFSSSNIRFFGNGLWDRVNCMVMQPERRPDFDFVKFVAWPQVLKYTLLQLGSVVLIFFVAFNFFMPEGSPAVAVVFPVIIAILIPLREYWIPTKWAPGDLKYLDPPHEDVATEDDIAALADQPPPHRK